MNVFENLTLIEPPLTITPDALLAEGRKRVRRRRFLALTATSLALVGGGALAVSLLTGGLSTAPSRSGDARRHASRSLGRQPHRPAA
jgi:hypothetical protein